MSSPVEIPFSVWRKIAMASWRERKDPTIAATLDVDAGPVLDYIEQVRRATGVRVTPAHLVGRAAAKVVEALPGLNGRVVFGSFAPSPTIDGFFVVSLRTDPVAGTEAAATDLSGSVIREVDTKPPWVIASELARRAKMIRGDRDPQFKQAKTMVQNLPPMVLRSRTRRWPGADSRRCGPCCRSASASTTASSTATRPRPWRGSSGSTWPIRPGTTRYPRRGRRPCHRGRRSCPRDARRPPGCSGGDHGAQSFPEVLLEVGDLAHRLGGGTRKRVEHLSPRVSPSGIAGGHRAPRRG